MEKIKMITPLVEMDGDEMTRILWGMIKDQLILPFVDLKTEYYDLGLLHRNETQDQVTVDAANATRRLGVADIPAAVYIKEGKAAGSLTGGITLESLEALTER